MSGFSFDPSRPPRSASFKRLASAKVGAGVESNGEASPAPPPRQIFNEFSSSSLRGGSQRDPPGSAVLEGLESAVDNLSESSTVLGYIASSVEEIERANSDAAQVSVQDVVAAVDLADRLFERIRENERLAQQAHNGKLSTELVQRFLS